MLAARLRAVLEESGSRAFVEDLIVDYVQTARSIGAGLGLPEDLMASLGDLCVPASVGAA